MARLSSLDKIAEIRSSTGDPTTGDVPNAQLALHLWLAEMEIAEMYEFANLRTHEDLVTNSSTDLYTMAAEDILKFLEPANNLTANFPVKLRDADWYRNTGLYLGASEPYYYWEEGTGTEGRRQVRLSPPPSGQSIIRMPYIKIPTAPDHDEANFSDLPDSHWLQVLQMAISLSLQFQNQRKEAKAQEELKGPTALAARRALPAAGYYKHHVVTFQSLLRRKARR
jgi:hypothetical protein